MYKEERRRKIKAWVEEHGEVSVTDLAEEYQVSKMTIRRDLEAMYEQGQIERTHGGALVPKSYHQPFTPLMLDRMNVLKEEKRRIASAVVKMIGKGEKVYLSSGSTSYWVARALLDRDDLTVVINSLVIANLLAQNDHMEVIVVGGFLRRSELSLVGHFAQNIIKDIRVDKVIMGIRGIHPEYGLTSDNLQELMTDRAMMSMSENVIIVADHTKFGIVAAGLTAPVTAVKTIITSKKAPFEMVKTIREKGVQVIEV